MNKKILSITILVAAVIVALSYWKSDTSKIPEAQPVAQIDEAPKVEPSPDPVVEESTNEEPEPVTESDEPVGEAEEPVDDIPETQPEAQAQAQAQARIKAAQLALEKSWSDWNKLLAKATSTVGTKALLESSTFAALIARNPSEETLDDASIDAVQLESNSKTLQQNTRALASFYPTMAAWQQAKSAYDKQLPLWDAFKQKFKVDLNSSDAEAVAYLERKMSKAVQAEDYIVAARSADLIRNTYQNWPKEYQQALIDQATPKMITIASGEFLMGDLSDEGQKDELPVTKRQVVSFKISETEITFAQYDAYLIYQVMALNDDSGWGREQRPVVNISYSEATDFASWLSQVTRRQFTLPTEEQWEYAARSGSNTAFSFGDNLTQKARCEGCDAWGQTQSLEVKQFPPNQFGLFDMHGNVWEWTKSCHTLSYSPKDASAEELCPKYVARGGGWRDLPVGLRSANRNPVPPDAKSNQLGFRLVELRAE